MLTLDETAFILVDYQGKLARVMHDHAALHKSMKRLVKGMQLLDVPIIWLEQYPKGLGPTSDDVRALLEADHDPIAKMTFSGCHQSTFQKTLEQLDRTHCVVAGIEAHICVYQTVCDLLAAGKHVEFVQDAIASRTIDNKHIAIDKMKACGSWPTSVEMVLFELMGSAEHPCFKDISQLIK